VLTIPQLNGPRSAFEATLRQQFKQSVIGQAEQLAHGSIEITWKIQYGRESGLRLHPGAPKRQDRSP